MDALRPGGARSRRTLARPRATVLVKLIAAFVVPTLILFALFAAIAHAVAARNLEAALGTRLAAVAASAATQIRGEYLVDLQPGDRTGRAYLNARRKLRAVQRATGVERIMIFDRLFRSRVDTNSRVPIGSTYFQSELDRHEVARVFADGDAVSSVLFQGPNGTMYKAGYAPVRASERDPKIVLALGVEAPAAFFSRLKGLRRNLYISGAILLAIVTCIAAVTAAIITRPVRRLATAAERIGKGDLDQPIQRTSRDEIGLLADTMERMRADLRARDERMQMMLSGIAHEIRNPLGGMQLYAGILRDEIEEADERRPHVDRIERELGYLERVVSEFLDYARRPRPERGRVDLGELVGELVELARADAGATDVAITADLEPVVCEADAGQLRRALLNILRNAVQAAASTGGAAVRVAVAAAGDRARISVTNDGEPIADEVRARMFEPFFTTREKGTGLGLAFARDIVRDHGGDIDVRCAGGKTTFTIELDRSPGRRSGGAES